MAKMTALALCLEERTVQLMSQAFESVDTALRLCTDANEALDLLRRMHFDFLVVAAASDADSGDLIRTVRRSGAAQGTTVIAIRSAPADPDAPPKSTAHINLLKPLNYFKAVQAVHTAHRAALSERRDNNRLGL